VSERARKGEGEREKEEGGREGTSLTQETVSDEANLQLHTIRG